MQHFCYDREKNWQLCFLEIKTTIPGMDIRDDAALSNKIRQCESSLTQDLITLTYAVSVSYIKKFIKILLLPKFWIFSVNKK